jgi:hypothetical protein
MLLAAAASACGGRALDVGTARNSASSVNDVDSSTPGSTVPRSDPVNILGANTYHACAIRSAQELVCWGDPTDGKTTVPEGRYLAVSTGLDYTCAIRASDSSIACWGANHDGVLRPPSGAFNAISAGEDHACAIRADRTVACWGSPVAPSPDQPEEQFASVSSGFNYSCGLHFDGTTRCWGEIFFDMPGFTAQHYQSIAVSRDTPSGLTTDGLLFSTDGTTSTVHFTQLTQVLGGTFCGLHEDASVECHGTSPIGRIAAPAGPFTYVIVPRGDIALALRPDGSVISWGSPDLAPPPGLNLN